MDGFLLGTWGIQFSNHILEHSSGLLFINGVNVVTGNLRGWCVCVCVYKYVKYMCVYLLVLCTHTYIFDIFMKSHFLDLYLDEEIVI